MSEPTYVGNELELFAEATIWKSYLARQIAPRPGEEVLEVGAGLGGTTRRFCNRTHSRWLCLEPDPALAAQITRSIASGDLPACCRVEVGTIASLGEVGAFDTILYIDVLEHIEDDRGELERAARLLKPGGRIVALSPAHQWLFTPFDAAIGHYRRYSKRTLAAIRPAGLDLVRLVYLDSIGLFASLANKLLLHQSKPNPKQIAFWDRVLVRMSTVVDPMIGRSLGRSVLAVWQSPMIPGDSQP
jgi:SAM-dependent methyltransferase